MPDELRPNLFPALRYADADAAVAFLTGAFGFEEKEVHRGEDGSVAHAEPSPTPMPIMPVPGRLVRRSSASWRTCPTDRASTAPGTSRGTSGPSARTTRTPEPPSGGSGGWAEANGVSVMNTPTVR
jgi:hypothetical protein